MTSRININNPTNLNPSLKSIRDNFIAAATDIEELNQTTGKFTILQKAVANNILAVDENGITILPSGIRQSSPVYLSSFLTDISLDGSQDMAPAVNNALLHAKLIGASEVKYSGIIYISTPIKLVSEVVLSGDGIFSLIIKTRSDFVGNIIENVNWDELILEQPTTWLNGCPIRLGLKNIVIIGDGYLNDTPITSETGYGIRIYGRQLILENILITKTKGIGLLTKFPSGLPFPNFNTTTDTKFSIIQNIEIMETGYEGFVFDGPTDSYLNNIYVGWPAGSRFDDFESTGPKTSLLFPGEQIHGFRLINTCEIGFLHSYDNEYGYAIYIKPKTGTLRLRAKYLMGESSYGCVHIDTNVRYQIALLETHNNYRGPLTTGQYSSQAGLNPHVNIISQSGGRISNLDIYRQNNERGCIGLNLSGNTNYVTANVYATDTTLIGGGVGIYNNGFSCGLTAKIISSKIDNNSLLTIGYRESSSAGNNEIDIYVSNCNINVDFLGSAGSENSSTYKIKTRSAKTTEINNVERLGQFTYLSSDILSDDGVNKRRNKFLGSVNVNMSITSLQTLDIPYGNFLVKDPISTDINLTLSYVSGTLSAVTKLAVANIDTVNKVIKVFIECTGGNTGIGKITARI